MVRHLRPSRILEVGSGFSTRLSALAALKNGNTELICVEPSPDEALQRGFAGVSTLIKERVQDVDAELFNQLGDGDVLFVDSSHVSTIGSDVNYLLLDVLPRLNAGVVVHFHDVYLPFEFRKDWVLEELRFWNEQYLLHAFLAFNHDFEVVFGNNYMEHEFPREMRNIFPSSPWWGGGSFWIRRVPGPSAGG
jgi:hypothetical protein